MATIVNTPAPVQRESGTGFLIGVLLLLLVTFLFFAYALPAIRGAVSSPQVNVPGKIDVNVNRK